MACVHMRVSATFVLFLSWIASSSPQNSSTTIDFTPRELPVTDDSTTTNDFTPREIPVTDDSTTTIDFTPREIPVTDYTTTEPTTVTTTVPVTSETHKCWFEPLDPKTQDKLKEALKSTTKLVKFTIRFVKFTDGVSTTEYYPDDILNADGGDIFRPSQWTRSTNIQGETLLVLDTNFEVLSLSLLGIGVESLYVELIDKPTGCVTNLTSDQRVHVLRQLLFNDFKIPETGGSGSLGNDEQICNQRIHTDEGHAAFVYQCCHIDSTDQIVCADKMKGLWITVLLTSIFVIKILVALYSPSFIPDTYFRQKYTDMEYVHHIPEGKTKKTIRIVKTMNPEYYQSENPPVVMENLDELQHFKSLVECMHTDEINDLCLDRISFTVKSRKLLSEHYVPVSVIRMINDNLFLCKIRNIPALKPCCDAGILAPIKLAWRAVTWFSCLIIFAKLVLIGFIAVPWCVRLIIYYQYERSVMEEMQSAAKERNSGVSYQGSFTLFLSPVHPLFITIYVVVAIDALVYAFMGKEMRNQLRLTLRKCLRDMRERSLTDAYGWAIKWLFLPLTKYGIFGMLLLPLYWPFLLVLVIPVLVVTTFPALYLSVMFISHPFSLIFQRSWTDQPGISQMPNIKETLARKRIGNEMFRLKEDLTKKDICVQSLIIIACLVSFWSITFLLMECLAFFVEVAIYTLIGIIVNASATLRFVTLLFLVWVYAKGVLLGVHQLYLSYHKVIRDQLISGKKEEMLKVGKQDDFTQEDNAFRVQSSYNAADISSGVDLEVKNGVLSWQTSGLLVFLNRKDQPFTPLKFFFETNELDCSGVPGPVWKNTLAAFYSLLKMVVFLFFVVAVVLAFGNQFSSTNQTLAILAGGFLPFAFRNFLMKGSEGSSVNTSSVRFVTEFDRLVAQYRQKWPVADIIPEQQNRSKQTKAASSQYTSSSDAPVSDLSNTETIDKSVNNVTPGTSSDVALDIDTEVEILDMNVDLIVHVSSAEKMSHLVKRCVNVEVKRESEDPIITRTSAAFSNPMYSHT